MSVIVEPQINLLLILTNQEDQELVLPLMRPLGQTYSALSLEKAIQLIQQKNFQVIVAVSYTHLTLPTICSV